MPVLSIIACDMLEDELAYVLSNDSQLEQLILVEKMECFGLHRKLKSLGCIHALIPLDRIQEILKSNNNRSFPAFLKPVSGLRFIEKIRRRFENTHKTGVTIVANMLKMGLHFDSKVLKSEVYTNIRKMSSFSDRILIFYGTCGHSLVNIEKDFEDLNCQFFFLKDDKGEIVEDCISVALGGNDVYASTIAGCKDEGTFYLTPMWAAGKEQEFAKDKIPELNEFGKKYMKRYRRVAKINTGLTYEPDFDENVRDFARSFNLKIIELQGSKKIVEQSYQNAKNFS